MREQILQELIELSGFRELQPEEFTLQDFIDAMEKKNGSRPSRSTAERWLKELVERGVLAVEPGVYDPRRGRQVNAYRLVRAAGS